MKTAYNPAPRILTVFDGDGEPSEAYEFLNRVTETGAGLLYRAWNIQRLTRRTFEDFPSWAWGHFGITVVARSLPVVLREQAPDFLT